jgi:GT2 family glycosyltransferase
MFPQKPPLLSIIIPTFNRKEHLLRCLESIYKNTKHIFYEVIVVDGGSTDGTKQCIKNMPYLHYIEGVRGVVRANNIGFNEARGEYICWLNDDMLVLDNTLEEMIDFLMKEEKNVANIIGAFYFRQRRKGIFSIQCICGLPHAAFGMAKKNLIERLNYLDEQYIRYADLDFSLKAWESGAVIVGCKKARLEHIFLEDEERAGTFHHLSHDEELLSQLWSITKIKKIISSIPEKIINRYFEVPEKIQYLLNEKILKGLDIPQHAVDVLRNSLPKDAESFFALGESILITASFYSRQKEYAMAEELINFISSLPIPQEEQYKRLFTQLFYLKGSISEMRKMYSEASFNFKKVLEFADELGCDRRYKGGAHFHLGCIYRELKDMESAKHHFKECLKLIPNHRRAKEELEQLQN